MSQLRIGILGTGNLATALGRAWRRAGHDITVGGRSPGKTQTAAAVIGAHSAEPAEVVSSRDAVLLAVSWSGVVEMLRLAEAPQGNLAGTTLVDPTNAVEHSVGVLLTKRSAAQRIAELARDAHVVKAFNLFPSDRWLEPAHSNRPPTVVICGDDQRALDMTGRLVSDVGASPAVLGGLERAASSKRSPASPSDSRSPVSRPVPLSPRFADHNTHGPTDSSRRSGTCHVATMPPVRSRRSLPKAGTIVPHHRCVCRKEDRIRLPHGQEW